MKTKTHRLPAESTPAWQAAKAYFEMGVDRSKRAVGKKLSKSGSLIDRWAVRHRWVARAREWDAEQEALEAKARLDAIGDDAKKWRVREEALRQERYDWSVLLIKAGCDILKKPFTDVRPSDAAKLIEAGAKLRALAAGAPTDKTETVQSGTIKVETDSVDLSRLTTEQLDQLETIAIQLQPAGNSQGKG